MYKQEEIISATAVLLSVAKADEIIEKKELESIQIILADFFKLKCKDEINEIIDNALVELDNAIDIFEFGNKLNKYWDYQDKIDFIRCTFEVAFIDKKMHYLEEHTIKKISSILNVEHDDLINSKKEIKHFLNLK